MPKPNLTDIKLHASTLQRLRNYYKYDQTNRSQELHLFGTDKFHSG